MNIVTQDDTDTKSAWSKLNQFLLQRSRQWHTDEEAPAFASFERELHERLMALERALLDDEIARYDVDNKEVEVCGERYHRVMPSGKNYLTTAGEVRVERHLYRRIGSHDERCICPLDYRVGIIDGYVIPRAARQMSWVTAHLPPRTAAELFEEIGGMKPSHTTIDQQPKMISEQWETNRLTWENALRQAEEMPAAATTLAVSLYVAYVQQGLPIASGVIEATCKTLVTQCMKCSGMRWSSLGGQAVLTLRALVQSGRWQQAWQLIEAAFRIPVSIVKEQLAPESHKDTVSNVVSWASVPFHINSAREYDSLPLVA